MRMLMLKRWMMVGLGTRMLDGAVRGADVLSD